MNRIRDLVDLSAVYEAVKAPKLTDPKAKQGTKPGKPLKSLPEVKAKEVGKEEKNSQPFFHKDSGPANADGFKAPAIDPIKNKGKENHYEPEKFSNTDEKSVKEDINNFMSNKSIFDKLYEDVMGGPDASKQDELDAVELDVKPEGEGEGEDVTLSLPRELAEKLHDALNAVLGAEEAPVEGEGENDESEEMGGGADSGSEQQETPIAGEAVDAEEVGTPIVDGEKLSKGLNKVSSGSNVVPSDVSTQGKKAGKGGDSKVTDKVGADGDKGHALVGGGVKGGAPTSPKGKSNVVNSRIKGNNQSAFDV